MHSRTGHQHDHDHRCHGRGGDRDSLLGGGLGGGGLGGVPGGGLGGGSRLRGPQDRFGGRESMGWGRDGRVRLGESALHQRRPGSLGGLGGGLGRMNLGGDGFEDRGGGVLGGGLGGGRLGYGGGMVGGVGGGLVGGMGGRRGLESLGGRGSDFMDRENPYLRQERGLGMVGARLGGGMGIGMGMGTGLGGLGGGSRTPSLRGSNFSLEHLDRQPRTYHYQPPYVEDWESIAEEEEMMQMMMMAQQGGEFMSYGPEDYGGGIGMGMRRGRL